MYCYVNSDNSSIFWQCSMYTTSLEPVAQWFSRHVSAVAALACSWGVADDATRWPWGDNGIGGVELVFILVTSKVLHTQGSTQIQKQTRGTQAAAPVVQHYWWSPTEEKTPNAPLVFLPNILIRLKDMLESLTRLTLEHLGQKNRIRSLVPAPFRPSESRSHLSCFKINARVSLIGPKTSPSDSDSQPWRGIFRCTWKYI